MRKNAGRHSSLFLHSFLRSFIPPSLPFSATTAPRVLAALAYASTIPVGSMVPSGGGVNRLCIGVNRLFSGVDGVV